MTQNRIVPDRYHSARRRAIIEAHPEIRRLMVVDPSFKYVALLCAYTQIFAAYCLGSSPFLYVFFFGLAVGSLFNCAIANSLHEIVHDGAFQGHPLANKIFGNFLNFAFGMPAIGGYYKSHRYHHSYLGTDLDVKYPPVWEAQSYDKNLWTRLNYVFRHPFLGGARWVKTAEEKPTNFAYWNTVSVYTFDFFVLLIFGWKSLFYLIFSFWINDTVFVQGSKNFADHWVDENSTHTNSYYGHFNLINFNIGYHREHHDFPNVPGRYLPVLRNEAIEFYSDEQYVRKSIFSDIWVMLTAPSGQGLTKFANKLQVKSVASVNRNLYANES